ncbi:MAG: N-acetylmuramoyl-L-alanine amidase [Oscillospiraceae bacterium]|nr:N-acetylmuramoyl-L-alanine amidase [Oscillospiraceae bacterium]
MASLFLSPSTQEFNPYVTTGNEEFWMNLLADQMVPNLNASGVNVVRNDPGGTVGDSVRASNAGDYDFHLALHSNAAPANLAGQLRGVDVYYYPGSTQGLRMANIIVDNIKEVYPLPERVRAIATGTLYELRRTRIPAVLGEFGYHDNLLDARWIENNLNSIARSLALSVTEYFGLPFLSPGQVRKARVQTVSGPLNLRGAPSSAGRILAVIPNGSPVEVLNAYNGWYVVRYGDTIGYVLGEYLQFT